MRGARWAPSLIGIYSSLVFVGAISFTLLGGLLVRRFGAVRCSQAALTIAGGALAGGAAWAIKKMAPSAAAAPPRVRERGFMDSVRFIGFARPGGDG